MISDTHSGVDDGAAADGGAESQPTAQQTSWIGRHWRHLVVAALASFPALLMLSWIGSGNHVQFADYWVFLSELINPDGSVRWGALTEFQGQHILSVPFLIYLINIWLFGGSNITLGFIVVAIVATQVSVLWLWIRRFEQVPFVLRAAFVVLVSALLFSPYGAWNFLKAMSGTAWLTANLIVILAIHLAAKDRKIAAMGMALVATVTYGTGVMVWPALIVVLIAKRRPLQQVAAVLGVGAVVVGTYVAIRSSQVRAETLRSVDLWDALMMMARINGRLAGLHADLVVAVGLLVVLAAVVLGFLAFLRCGEQAAPFIGLGAFSLMSSAQIAYGRTGISFAGGIDTGRYTSLGALLVVSLAGMAVALMCTMDRKDLFRGVTLVLLVPMVIGAVSAPFRDRAGIRADIESDKRLLHLSDAQRLKVSRGQGWFPLIAQPDIDDRLERIGHHPFDGRWDADCGWLGRRFEGGAEPIEGRALVQNPESLPDGVRVNVAVDLDSSDVGCVIVLEEDDLVVGAGRVAADGAWSGDRTMLFAYAPVESEPARVLISTPGDRWVEVPVTVNTGS